jgi:hypothetical protein
MPIEQRRHIRFSLDIPAVRYTKYGEKMETTLNQISIGGCLLDPDDHIYVGDEIRVEIQLPNKNWLPLYCKVLYIMEDVGIGAQFINITRFEQELVAKIIAHSLEKSGLPVQINPFENPPKFRDSVQPRLTDKRRDREDIIERIMSTEIDAGRQ